MIKTLISLARVVAQKISFSMLCFLRISNEFFCKSDQCEFTYL